MYIYALLFRLDKAAAIARIKSVDALSFILIDASAKTKTFDSISYLVQNVNMASPDMKLQKVDFCENFDFRSYLKVRFISLRIVRKIEIVVILIDIYLIRLKRP